MAYTVELLDYEDGDEAGHQERHHPHRGRNAYGYLKSENGVHRLVRVSPFDANARRQTSFAALEVMPELDDDSRDRHAPRGYRDAGVPLLRRGRPAHQQDLLRCPSDPHPHRHRGSCQTERSQFQNRDNCYEDAPAKLAEIKEQQHVEKIERHQGRADEDRDEGWGSQIRSYVFMPYTLVKDHPHRLRDRQHSEMP